MSHWESPGKSDEYYTPKYVSDALECHFDTDVAAPKDRTHCHIPADRFITENSLDMEWTGFCWMNPPFGGRNSIQGWLNKMITHGNGIALTPDRTSAEWWQDTAQRAHGVLFVAGKIKFIRPDGSIAKQPSNGTTLFAFGDQAFHALQSGSKNMLGTLL